MMQEPRHIIDISQPISAQTACFPGDTPFSRHIQVSHEDSGFMNLCAFTMSPHVGTHADAPVHVRGRLDASSTQEGGESAGHLPLSPYVGPVAVIDVSPCSTGITWAQIQPLLQDASPFPKRILFKTRQHVRYDRFESDYAWLTEDLIQHLSLQGVCLVGLDTPSVDACDSKSLDTHHALLASNMVWLENLDLSAVPISPGEVQHYFLVALPLKFMDLEASPLRAVLLV